MCIESACSNHYCHAEGYNGVLES
ncbi:MAG: CxxxxCH/CxxCH domain-containing protein [Syntrophobacteria bacterium]